MPPVSSPADMAPPPITWREPPWIPPKPGAKPPPPPPTTPTSLFTLQNRPAPGLYTLAWLLSVVGLVLLIVAVTAGGSIAGIMFIASVLILLGGLSSAAGYQIIHRGLRPAAYFRGPSPVLLFALQLILVNILSAVLLIAGVPVTADTGVGFLIASAVLLAGYLFVVWLYGLRSGALDMRGLGIPAFGLSRWLSDIAVGALIMLGVAFLDALWGGLLSLLLNSSTPDVVPTPNTAADLVMVAVGACLLVPIGEELFFRGYSVTAWLRDLGERTALIRSMVFFALVHVINILVEQSGQGALDGLKQAVLEVLVIAPVGLVLGWLFLRRGLVTSISGHAAFNLVGVLSLALVHGR